MFDWDGLPSKEVEIDAVRTSCYNGVRQMNVTLREAATFEKNVIMIMMAVDVSHEKVLNAQAGIYNTLSDHRDDGLIIEVCRFESRNKPLECARPNME